MKRLLLVTVLAVAVAPASAQEPTTGAVTGVVRAPDSQEPISGAVIAIDGTFAGAITEADGSYRLEGLQPGEHTLRVTAPGYREMAVVVVVRAGETEQLDIAVGEAAVAGETIVVTGSRSPEKLLDAPVTVEVVSEDAIAAAGGASYLSALADVKGIDFAEAGVNEHRVSMRGFNTQFNSRLLSMIDGRVAQLPGSGLPQANLLPSSPIDMKSIEVVVGPASALYGPNAHTGVINVITKSPWDESGATVSVRGGTQNLVDVAARVADVAGDTFGWKLTGQYLRADDFEPDRDAPMHYYGTSIYEGDLIDGYDVRSAKASGTAYYKFADDWFAKASYGWSLNDGFSLTNAGRNHIRDWQVATQTVQLSGPRVYAQITRTATDAGTTYQMERLARLFEAAGGLPDDMAEIEAAAEDIAFIDRSQLIDADLQYRHELLGVRTTVGAQYRLYLPDSDGSYLEDGDGRSIEATELGAYLQLDYRLLDDRLRLAGAARVDHHTNYPTQVSPKASVVYEVAPLHNVRAGYNRAFKSPTILEQYLLISGTLVGNRRGFEIRDAGGAVIASIDPLEPEQVDGFELGYKGVVMNRLYLDAVAYQSWYRNFISPLTLLANPGADDPTFAYYPDGTIVGESTAAPGTLFTYQNFGQARVRGVDVGATLAATEHLELSASASAIDLVSFSNDSELQRDLLLNVPAFKLKGSVAVRDLARTDSFVRASARWRSAYRFESGYWNSANFYDDGEVPSRFALDLAAGYTFRDYGLSLTATVANVLDDHTVDVLGAPPPRRFAYLQLTYGYPFAQ